MRNFKAAACFAVAAVATMLLSSAGVAAPVTYSFTTALDAFGGPSVSGGPFPDPNLFFGGASGTFTYDPSALAFTSGSDGSTIYRGFTPQSSTGFVTGISSLSGTVAGLNFGDASGTVQVGNDTSLSSGTGQKTDILQLSFDPSLGSTSPRNLSGFDISGFTLFNVRMFWIEGQSTPEPIADFLNDQSLPLALPTFHGRISFDFVPTNSPTGPQSFVFFDSLTVTPLASVPEPATLAMLLTALLLLAAQRWRLHAGPESLKRGWLQ